MDLSRAQNGSADRAAPALIGFTRAERHRSRALCRSWRWIHGPAGPDGVIPKLPAPPTPWRGSLWTPHCPAHPSRARGRGTHSPVFIVIPRSQFSSFGMISPTVVALSASSPSEVRDPPPRAGAQSAASIGVGRRWGLSQSLWRRILFSPITSAAHGGATGAAATPREMRGVPGAEQDPGRRARSSAPHLSRDKDTAGHCLAPSSQSGESHQDRGSSRSLAEGWDKRSGWDKVKREVAKWSRICPAHGWDKLQGPLV